MRLCRIHWRFCKFPLLYSLQHIALKSTFHYLSLIRLLSRRCYEVTGGLWRHRYALSDWTEPNKVGLFGQFSQMYSPWYCFEVRSNELTALVPRLGCLVTFPLWYHHVGNIVWTAPNTYMFSRTDCGFSPGIFNIFFIFWQEISLIHMDIIRLKCVEFQTVICCEAEQGSREYLYVISTSIFRRVVVRCRLIWYVDKTRYQVSKNNPAIRNYQWLFLTLDLLN